MRPMRSPPSLRERGNPMPPTPRVCRPAKAPRGGYAELFIAPHSAVKHSRCCDHRASVSFRFCYKAALASRERGPDLVSPSPGADIISNSLWLSVGVNSSVIKILFLQSDLPVAAMTKPSLRDTLIFIVIFFTMVAAMFALVLFGMR